MSRTGVVGVGIIGAGMISEQYLTNLAKFPDVEVVVIGDIDINRSQAAAAKWGIERFGTAEDVLSDEAVEIIINLTIPAAHVEVSTAALMAGKHVWSEKPIGVDRESSRQLVELAESSGLLVGIAPDTVLGSGWQTAKRAIEAGIIGKPLTAVTSMQWQGPEWFHPAPEFLFAPGGGPVFDMGPYYFTALVHLLGPVAAVSATSSIAAARRVVRVGPRAGQVFDVETPTHLSVLTRFESGGSAQSVLSFDTPLFRHGQFEVTGTEGTLVLPDPNTFGGSGLHLYRPMTEFSFPIEQPFELIPEVGQLDGRGLGVLTMARTLRSGDPLHVATAEVGFHVLDTMVGVLEAAESNNWVQIESTVEPVRSLPEDFDPRVRTV